MKLNPPHVIQQPDVGLLFMRVSGSLLVLYVHGLPKIFNWQAELQIMDDPLHWGKSSTLICAIFAEVICPLAILAGIFTRLACLPFLVLLLVAMLGVHADWSIEQGQFGWLLLILFGSITLCGPGRYTLAAKPKPPRVY